MAKLLNFYDKLHKQKFIKKKGCTLGWRNFTEKKNIWQNKILIVVVMAACI